MAKKILLAEDSVTMQKVVQLTFEAEDFTVSSAASAREALARAREMTPDVVIADLSLPDQSGYELCSALKRNGSARVLLMHGVSTPLDRRRAQAAQADGEIAKPFETQALIDKVQELASTPLAAAGSPQPAEDIVIDTAALGVSPSLPPDASPSPRSPAAAPKPDRAELPLKRPAAVSLNRPQPSRSPTARPSATKTPARDPLAPRGPAKPLEKPRPKPGGAQPRRAPVVAPPSSNRVSLAEPAAGGPGAAPPAQEITIEAEPPPPTAAEPLPSFDGQSGTVTVEPAARARGGRTIHGTPPAPGGGVDLPPPPPGMPLPGVPSGRPPAAAVPVEDVPTELSPLPAAPGGATPPAAEPAGRKTSASTLEALRGQVDPAVYEAIVQLSREVIEQIVWEVVPELAETIVRERLAELVKARTG